MGDGGAFVKPKGHVTEEAGHGVAELGGVACRRTGVRQPGGRQGPGSPRRPPGGDTSERRGRAARGRPAHSALGDGLTPATRVRASPLPPRWPVTSFPKAQTRFPLLPPCWRRRRSRRRNQANDPGACPQGRDCGPQGRGPSPRHLHCDSVTLGICQVPGLLRNRYDEKGALSYLSAARAQ